MSAPSQLVFQEFSAFAYQSAACCPGCSRVEEPGAVEMSDAPPPTFDVSETLDGAVITSDAFRNVCADVPGATFAEVPGLADHWLMDVTPVVPIDPFMSRVRSGAACATCGLPRYVMSSGPLRVAGRTPVPTGFSRTDLEFGDSADFGPHQPVRLRPHILVDRGTAHLLKSASLLGVHLITQP